MQRRNISRVILGMTSATIVGVVLTAPTSNSEFQDSHSGRATVTTGD